MMQPARKLSYVGHSVVSLKRFWGKSCKFFLFALEPNAPNDFLAFGTPPDLVHGHQRAARFQGNCITGFETHGLFSFRLQSQRQ